MSIGDNRYGQLGRVTNPEVSSNELKDIDISGIYTGLNIIKIACGANHTLC